MNDRETDPRKNVTDRAGTCEMAAHDRSGFQVSELRGTRESVTPLLVLGRGLSRDTLTRRENRMRAVFSRLACTARKGVGLVLVLSALAGAARAGALPPPTPEIDPGSMASALTLLIGGAMVLTGRSRRR